MPLWKVFKPDRVSDALLSGVKHLRAQLAQIRNKEVDQDALDLLIPLSKTLSSGQGSARKKISLYHASDTQGEQWASGYVDLDFRARVEESQGMGGSAQSGRGQRAPQWC